MATELDNSWSEVQGAPAELGSEWTTKENTPSRNFLREAAKTLRGISEAGATFATGIPGFLGGAAAGLTTAAVTGAGKATGLGFKDIDPVKAGKAVQEGVANYLTFQPVTEFGKQLVTPSKAPQLSELTFGDLSPNALLNLGSATARQFLDPRRLLTAPAEIAKEALNLPLESWNAPSGVRYPVEVIGELASYPFTGKGFKGAKSLIKDIINERKGVVEPYKVTAPSKVREELSTTDQKIKSLEAGEKADELIQEKFSQLKEPERAPTILGDEWTVAEETPVISRNIEEPKARQQVVQDLYTTVKDKVPTWQEERLKGLAETDAALWSADDALFVKSMQETSKGIEVPKAEVTEPAYTGKREATGKMFLTKADEVGLTELGYTTDEISKLKPAEGERILAEQIKPELKAGNLEFPKVTLEIPEWVKKEREEKKTSERLNINQPEKQTTDLTSETAPKEWIVVVKDASGKNYLGEPGETHAQIIERNNLAWGSETGFLDKNGQYLRQTTSPEITKFLIEPIQQRIPAIKIDDKVYTADLPDGSTHNMVWNDIPEGAIAKAKSVESGWAYGDGSNFGKKQIDLRAEKLDAKFLTVDKEQTVTDINDKGVKLSPEEPFYRIEHNEDGTVTLVDGKEITTTLKELGNIVGNFSKEPNPAASTGGSILYSGIDPTQLSSTLKSLKTSVRDTWEITKEKFPVVDVKLTTRGLKEFAAEQADVLSKDPVASKKFDELLTAEDSKHAFRYRVLKDYAAVIKGIKKGSESDIKIGEALNGEREVSTLNPQELKAYKFMKENYDAFIHKYAREAAGSQEAYQRILNDVGREVPSKTKLADLSPEQLKEYKALSAEADKIRNGRKVIELKGEEKSAYYDKRQEMRDFLNKDYVSNLPEGERAAYDILSRRIDQYLPHLFDPKELLEYIQKEIVDINKKLETATNKSSVTRYKNRLVDLGKAVDNLQGGKFVSFRQLPSEIFFRFFNQRKGAEGYSRSAMKAFETYVYGISKKIFDEPAIKSISRDFDKVTPELRPYLQDVVDHYLGSGKYRNQSLDKLASFITTAQWIRLLGFNPRSAITNLSQRINTIAYVGEKYSLLAEKMMLEEGFHKVTDKTTGTERTYKANEIFEKSGIASEVPQVLNEGSTVPESLKAANTAARFLFNKVELGNRKHAYLAGYLKALDEGAKKGLSGKELEAFAEKTGIDTVHETQFRYGKLGMPKMFWSPAGRVIFQFTSYPLKEARFLYRLYKNDKVAFLKAIAYMEGVNYTLQELLDTDLSNALGIGITWGELFNSVFSLAKGDTKGAMRHLSQTVTPGAGLLPSGPGPMISGAIKIAQKAGEGQGIEQLKKELTPVMYKRLKDAALAVKGKEGDEYPIFDTKGNRIYLLSGKQLLQRTLGPRTAKEHKENLIWKEEQNLEQERKEVLSEITTLLLDESDESIDKAVDLMEKYEIAPTDKQLNDAMLRQLTTPEERKKLGKKEEYQVLREGQTVRERRENPGRSIFDLSQDAQNQ